MSNNIPTPSDPPPTIRVRHKWQHYRDLVHTEVVWAFLKHFVHHKGDPENEYEITVEYPKDEWRLDT